MIEDERIAKEAKLAKEDCEPAEVPGEASYKYWSEVLCHKGPREIGSDRAYTFQEWKAKCKEMNGERPLKLGSGWRDPFPPKRGVIAYLGRLLKKAYRFWVPKAKEKEKEKLKAIKEDNEQPK